MIHNRLQPVQDWHPAPAASVAGFMPVPPCCAGLQDAVQVQVYAWALAHAQAALASARPVTTRLPELFGIMN